MFEKSGRFDGVEFSAIRKLLELAPPDSINFGIGQPDYNPPQYIKEAMKGAIDRNLFSYPHTMGIPRLREDIAAHYNEKYGTELKSNNVLITAGATEALNCVLSSCTNRGDKVLITDPTFNVLYEGQCKKLGLEISRFSLDKEKGFSLDIDAFSEFVEAEKPKLAIINYPANPTGRVEPPEKFIKIFKILEDHRIPAVSDEVYSRLIYNGESFVSAIKNSENVVVVNSLSKSAGMCGSRIGWAITTHEIMDTMTVDHMYRVAGVDKIGQAGAQAFFEKPEETKKFLDGVKKEYRNKRDRMISGLKGIGIDTYTPEGAFYVFPSIEKFAPSSTEFVAAMMHKGVIVSPGYAFGPSGRGHVRVSYARTIDEIDEGLKRMKTALESMH